MSIKQPINRRSIFEGTDVKVRRVDIPPEFNQFLRAHSIYKEQFKAPSDDELRALPSGVLLTQTGLARAIRNACPRDHSQLICYRQPLLDNVSTDYFLKTVIDNDEGKYAKDIQEYVRTNSAEMFTDFPFAFQMAYDIHTTGTITDKTRGRKRVIEERFAEIMKNL